ncbi:MAG: hypothetical protein ACRC6F_03630, partial [Aeromonas sp.]
CTLNKLQPSQPAITDPFFIFYAPNHQYLTNSGINTSHYTIVDQLGSWLEGQLSSHHSYISMREVSDEGLDIIPNESYYQSHSQP